MGADDDPVFGEDEVQVPPEVVGPLDAEDEGRPRGRGSESGADPPGLHRTTYRPAGPGSRSRPSTRSAAVDALDLHIHADDAAFGIDGEAELDGGAVPPGVSCRLPPVPAPDLVTS